MSTAHCPSCGTDHQPESGECHHSTWAGRTLPNGLRVLEKLGSTRDGPLYHAKFPSGREVALLTPEVDSGDPDHSPDSLAAASLHPRFRQAAKIRHVNVAAVIEIGELPDGPAYVVLEYLTGEPLSHVLADRGVLPGDEAVDLFLQTAAGLGAGHDVGVVHANLSPENILVTHTAGGPVVKLIGFAPVSFSPLGFKTPTYREVGLEYASPERIAGYTPDQRSDVFSLGAVLHHLLVGAPPSFGSEGFASAAMRATVAQAVLPIPEHRFQTIAEFVAAVRHAIAVGAAPKRSRARRPLVLTAASILVMAAGGLWLGASKPWRGPVAGTEATSAAEPQGYAETEPATDAEEPPSIDSTIEPPAAVPPKKPRPRRTAAVERALNGPEAVLPPTGSTPAEDSAKTSPPVDSSAMALPPPPAELLTLEERAQVAGRIGLDEARRLLGGPAHAIEGMSPLFMGLARSRFPEGADTSRPLVRGVYLDSNGAVILLDQQQVGIEPPAPAADGLRWTIGRIVLFLHGETGLALLKNLAKRVR